MLFVFICLGSVFFLFREKIVEKYDRFNNLYNIVSLRYNNRCVILYHTISIIYKSTKISLLNSIFLKNNNVKKIERNLWEISYEINGKKYKMIVRPNRGPSNIRKIYDNDNNDITEYISEYLGPNNDFHKSEILTPEFFNLKSINIEKDNGTTEKFINNEKLNI